MYNENINLFGVFYGYIIGVGMGSYQTKVSARTEDKIGSNRAMLCRDKTLGIVRDAGHDILVRHARNNTRATYARD